MSETDTKVRTTEGYTYKTGLSKNEFKNRTDSACYKLCLFSDYFTDERGGFFASKKPAN
jgi:hypothetical protein